jgi:hypothetical protein
MTAPVLTTAGTDLGHVLTVPADGLTAATTGLTCLL